MTRFSPKGDKKYVSRSEFLSRLGKIKVVEPLTRAAFEYAEDKMWRERHESNPHGVEWHTSFHASSFPGNDPRACMRYQQYVLMDDPGKEAPSRRLRGQGQMGKAIEDMLVDRWGAYGILLPTDDPDKKQIGFEDKEFWLTGSADAPIIPTGWTRPHVVEVKSKAADVIRQMKRNERGPDPKHVNQIKTYIGLIHEQSDRWPELDPCVDGTLYYVSRDDPEQTHEFFFSYDPTFIRTGREKLQEAQNAFIEGDLLPHPFNGKEWNSEPCKWCKFKKFTCKPDYLDGVDKLENSRAVTRAKEIYGDYDYEETRNKVLERWK